MSDDMFEKPEMVDVIVSLSPMDMEILDRIAHERDITIWQVIQGMIRDGLTEPNFHVCLFDRHCWRDWWHYGMPLRVYFTPKKRTVMFTILSGKWRHGRVWETEPVRRKES